MKAICASRNQLPCDTFRDLSAYRYEVFVNQLGWKLGCPQGMELDEFDRDDTEYVVARHEDGRINACARLLPTVGPNLLSDVFPFLLHGHPIPRDEGTWEVSRFTTWENRAPSAGEVMGDDTGQMASMTHTRRFAHAVLERAAQLGARRLVTVSPYGMERLLRRVGVPAHRVGPPVAWQGQLLIACWIDVLAA